MIIAESGSRIITYQQDIWAGALKYSEMDCEEALQLFGVNRKMMTRLLEKLPEETWHQYIIHPDSGKISLLDWIQLYIDHIDMHIQQLNRVLYDFNSRV